MDVPVTDELETGSQSLTVYEDGGSAMSMHSVDWPPGAARAGCKKAVNDWLLIQRSIHSDGKKLKAIDAVTTFGVENKF